MTIQGVSAGTVRDFSRDEEEALRHEPSCSATLNQARRGTGDKGADVAVRGDDKTLDDELEAKKTHLPVGEIAETITAAVKVGADNGLHRIHLVEQLLHKPGVIVGLGVATFVATQVALAEMQNTKDGVRDAATRDVMRGGMLLSLELPASYRDREIQKLGIGTSAQAPATKIANQIIGTPKQITLQHQADQGTHAAIDMLASRASREELFESSPAIADRYASDPAFRAGFDAYVETARSSRADAETMKKNVEARDARYQTAGVPVRA